MRISDWSSDVCSSDLRPVDILTVGRDEAERAVIIADPRGQRDRGVRNAVSGAEVQIDIVPIAERILLGRIGDHAGDRHRTDVVRQLADAFEIVGRRAAVVAARIGVPGDADVGRRSRRDFGIETAIDVELELAIGRSEEHTSELQSLMRNSYAVFCLKNKTHKKYKHTE